MEIRNLMEDRVLSLVNEICDEDEQQATGRYCTSTQCRLDTACYVLNRIPQRYVTSGRGFAHLEADFQENPQLQIDLVTLVNEGLQRITSIQRSFYTDENCPGCQDLTAPYYYFFPTIKGRIYNGMTFEPISNLKVNLSFQGKPVPMVDPRWSNPFIMFGSAPGTYLFWPAPIEAEANNTEHTFELAITINSDTFEPFTHYISIPVHSEPVRSPKANIRDFNVSDLFLIPQGKAAAMEYSLADDGGDS